VTTRRGWWPALEPVLLAFAVVVCGGILLPAQSRTPAFDRDHQCGTSGSDRWTSTATLHDSSDDGDDVGDGGIALLAGPIIVTGDDGLEGPLVQTEVAVPLLLRSAQLASRGPPDRDLPSRATANTDSSDGDIDDDDDDDDDDDRDDDSSEPGESSRASNRGQTWILIASDFDDPFSVASDDHSLRAPPQ
jgi:hypothetical protein